MWQAVPLPEHAENILNNVLVCTRRGPGAVGIRGADYDGDGFMF